MTGQPRLKFVCVVSPHSPFRFHRLGRLLLVVAVCLSLGGHWVALQTVAWTGMIVTYAQSMSVGQAMALTFGGEHPCGLCKAVEAGQQQEKKPDTLLVVKKGEVVLVVGQAWYPRLVMTNDVGGGECFAPAFRAAPPTPPPRV